AMNASTSPDGRNTSSSILPSQCRVRQPRAPGRIDDSILPSRSEAPARQTARPLDVRKPVTLEGKLSEGSQYKLGQVSAVQNRAFTAAELREQFPIKKGALMGRTQIAMGRESLRQL